MQHGDEDGFFDSLRRLGKLKKERLGGQPSDRALAEKAKVRPTTVGDWLRGNRFPQEFDPIRAVLREVQAEAYRRGLLDEETKALLDEGRLHEVYRAEAARRTRPVRDGVQRAQAHRVLTHDERLATLAALPDKPRPLGQWSPRRLGVHPAVPGRAATTPQQGFVLPAYVPRPHDAELRAHLVDVAAAGDTSLVVVLGASCSGKTRTAYEAVRAALSDWELIFPTGPDSLLAALTAGAVGPRTVLWLNEAQNFLYGPAGETSAAALLRRLDHPGPAVIVATLWPRYHQELTAYGTVGPHPHARSLLAQAHRTDIPAAFTDDDLDILRDLARSDASLALAQRTGAPAVTQILAAGPDLVHHYQHPTDPHGPYGQAVISAAIDARRLGVTDPIPLAMLEEAAVGYLTDAQRAAADPGSWFTHALAYARTKVKDVVAALEGIPHPVGMGTIPGVVRLADYLEEHGQAARRMLCPPAAFWTAAANHIRNASDLRALADAAHARWRLWHAALLYQKACDAGDNDALNSLAEIRERAGEHRAAERLYRQAFDAGDTSALTKLAAMREQAGDHQGAEQLYQQAAHAGDASARRRLGEIRGMARDREETERLVRQTVDSGSTSALTRLAVMRGQAGDYRAAERLYRQAAASGSRIALTGLASLRKRVGDLREAEQLYRQAASTGIVRALRELALMRETAGDYQEAERLARQAADAGDTFALTSLAETHAFEPRWQQVLRYGLEPDTSPPKAQ
ncbi:tetratricopeptide repeat protein [Kitasatospora atroaurantiaca]|uniref:tetratricopeptide repeat protein n=1 Tax=Kitasatospora atroaurantiaca TaxID=285545 RepID=UPI001FE665F4|nr:tetratricopeptide repeat protein [Kitasatospora atroaurantiaca]